MKLKLAKKNLGKELETLVAVPQNHFEIPETIEVHDIPEMIEEKNLQQ